MSGCNPFLSQLLAVSTSSRLPVFKETVCLFHAEVGQKQTHCLRPHLDHGPRPGAGPAVASAAPGRRSHMQTRPRHVRETPGVAPGERDHCVASVVQMNWRNGVRGIPGRPWACRS